MPLLGHNRRYSVIYVKDLVRGLLQAALSPVENEVFYLTHPDPLSWETFMEMAAAAMNVQRFRRIRVPAAVVYGLAQLAEARCRLLRRRTIFNRDKCREMRHPCWTCSGAKSEQLLHFAPRFPVAEALALTVGWYIEHGWL